MSCSGPASDKGFDTYTKIVTGQLKIITNLMSKAALAVCVASIFSSSTAIAQEGNFNQSSPIPKFSLQVSKQDSILRPEQNFAQKKVLDPMPWVNSAPAPAKKSAPPQIASAITQAPMPPSFAPVSPQVPHHLTPQTPQQAMVPSPPALDDRPNSYLEEYQVNWSPWISTLANRWHTILRDSETLVGVEFQTSKPALIQFTCYADGRIGNVFLRQSSGIPVYDRMQILSLMECGPLDPFPPGTQKRSVTLIQGWESHRKRPGEQQFNTRAFADRYPQERVSKWVSTQ